MAAIKTSDCEKKDLYKLLIGTVLPRPIAWVTSKSADGVVNLAPYSAYNMVCSNPTTVVFSAGWKPPGVEKDTLRNILETQEFVINTPRPGHIEAVALSAAPFPPNVSEVEQAGLTLTDSETIETPRIKDAVFSLECELQQTLQIGEQVPGSATLVLGTVKVFHIQDELLTDGRIDFNKTQVLSRLGGYCYGTIGEVLEQKVPEI
jgi:flavin reductase (DIM6/NTAB) family NADH-FMN oxidoreductase RutF